MLAEIITIGDEILIGQIVDTNSAFISKELNKIGISVYQITSIQDDKEHILTALEEARNRAQIIIVTGGLGPTKDDITKHTFCEYFDDTLVQNDAVLEHIEELFAKYISTTKITDVNRAQAMILSNAEALHNAYGTAPGMWIKDGENVFISLPGVPFEMKNLIKDQVVPKLIERFKRPYILHKTLVTYGMGESAIADLLDSWEENLPPFINLAYLPNLGKVRLRLTAKGPDREELVQAIDEEFNKLPELIGDIMFGYEDEETIETVVAKLFTKKKKTLATAESCTGGAIAQHITALAGASAYFKGSVVSYATETKINVLKVDETKISKHSVVSAEVAEAMAKNVQKQLNTDFAVATTGSAGPTKGESEADVGTVYIGIATPNEVKAYKFNMGNHRTRIIQKTVNKAFELLQKEILKF